jgi:hypothetical protein
MEEQILLDIASLLKESIITQLRKPRPVRGYYGQQKTVNGTPVPPSPPSASGNLIRNTKVYWQENFDGLEPELIVEMPDYYFFIEQGRRPGRYPPLRVIDRWAVQKRGLKSIRDEKGRFIPRKTQVFLMARSIAKYGFAGTPFLENAVQAVLPTIVEKMGDAVAEYFQNAINENRIIVLPQD